VATKEALRSVLDAGIAWRDLLRHRDVRAVSAAFVDGPDAEIARRQRLRRGL
jgi:hypothetical protein